jgi:hypothetical protein
MLPYPPGHYLFNNQTAFIFVIMKYICSLFCLFAICLNPLQLCAQKQLPDFTVVELSRNKIQVSWNNPFPDCIQLAVQRSTDSSRNFRTLFSSQSPELVSNGFVDTKPIAGVRNYYRIFYVRKGGNWFFTPSRYVQLVPLPLQENKPTEETKVPPTNPKENPPSAVNAKKEISLFIKKVLAYRFTAAEYQAFRDSINHQTNDGLSRIGKNSILLRAERPRTGKERFLIYFRDLTSLDLSKNEYQKFRDSIQKGSMDTLYNLDPWHFQLRPYRLKPNEIVKIYRNDTLLRELTAGKYRKFRDSISTRTKDTLFLTDFDKAEIHPYKPVYVWKPSPYVFTNNNGYVTILLPKVKQHRYQVIFFEADGTEIFRIKSVHEPELILDKTDFMHAGWFHFELYEDDKLKEKNKFQLTRN